MELNRELSTSCWKLSQQAGWTADLDAATYLVLSSLTPASGAS